MGYVLQIPQIMLIHSSFEGASLSACSCYPTSMIFAYHLHTSMMSLLDVSVSTK